jgi:hypothetical protein
MRFDDWSRLTWVPGNRTRGTALAKASKAMHAPVSTEYREASGH